MKEQVAIQRLLSRKLTEARIKNAAYSLRAFSRKLGVSSSAVSEIMNGKRTISAKLAERIVTRLSLDPKEAETVLSLFPKKRKNFRANGGMPQGLPAGEIKKMLQLSVDEFHAISDWYHFAILSLLETRGAKSDSAWIAKRLGISIRDASSALERMERLDLLKWENGKIALTGKSFQTTDDVNNLALRKTHAQNLELAKAALEIDDLGIRDFTAMTMAIDPKKIPEAKKLIREFRDRLCGFLEQGEKKEVYKFSVQLIPLSKGGETS
jgi:uncharacterized protein (TIGR02147 family)